MSDDDHDPNMYPRSMEIVGYFTIGVIGLLVFLLTVLLEGFYLAIGEIVGWLLLGLILTWLKGSRRPKRG